MPESDLCGKPGQLLYVILWCSEHKLGYSSIATAGEKQFKYTQTSSQQSYSWICSLQSH